MNDKQKIQEAFGRIKQDITSLSQSVNSLNIKLSNQETTLSLNQEIKEELDYLKKFDLENFVVKMEKELSSLNKFIQNFAKNSQEFSENMKRLHEKVDHHDKKAQEISETIEKKTTEKVEKLIEDKVSEEMTNLRFELQRELTRISKEVKGKN